MVQQFTRYHDLEEVLEAQDRADLTINETFRRLDVIIHGAGVDKRNTPPSSPADYDAYIVGDTPTGLWVDFAENSLAYWDGVAWQEFSATARGSVLYDSTLNEHFVTGDTGRSGLLHRSWVYQEGTVSASLSHYAGVAANHSMTIDSLTLVSSSTTTSDGSNNWSFQLTNLTTTNNLFATAPNTNGGMGDFAVNTAKVLVPDQNTTMASGDVLNFVATLTGSPGNLTVFHIQVDGHITV